MSHDSFFTIVLGLFSCSYCFHCSYLGMFIFHVYPCLLTQSGIVIFARVTYYLFSFMFRHYFTFPSSFHSYSLITPAFPNPSKNVSPYQRSFIFLSFFASYFHITCTFVAPAVHSIPSVFPFTNSMFPALFSFV